MFGEISGAIGSVVGVAVGTIVGLSDSAVGTALGITAIMAQEAIDAGCTTYDEVRDFHSL